MPSLCWAPISLLPPSLLLLICSCPFTGQSRPGPKQQARHFQFRGERATAKASFCATGSKERAIEQDYKVDQLPLFPVCSPSSPNFRLFSSQSSQTDGSSGTTANQLPTRNPFITERRRVLLYSHGRDERVHAPSTCLVLSCAPVQTTLIVHDQPTD